MEKTDISTENFENLCSRIFDILAELGPSQTTMDLLARRLTISKRTLYEIFGSKDGMIKTIMERMHEQYSADVEQIIKDSGNVMEALAGIFLYQQKAMTRISANFFIDMDTRYHHIRGDYENNARKWTGYISKAIRLGVRQGVFRDDVHYEVTVPLMRVQMESLKRMEEFFPPEITLLQAYNAIAIGMLRSIATPRGMQILDNLAPQFMLADPQSKKQNNTIINE